MTDQNGIISLAVELAIGFISYVNSSQCLAGLKSQRLIWLYEPNSLRFDNANGIFCDICHKWYYSWRVLNVKGNPDYVFIRKIWRILRVLWNISEFLNAVIF